MSNNSTCAFLVRAKLSILETRKCGLVTAAVGDKLGRAASSSSCLYEETCGSGRGRCTERSHFSFGKPLRRPAAAGRNASGTRPKVKSFLLCVLSFLHYILLGRCGTPGIGKLVV
uniref:Uncharacterized protein n=1 Tax=Hyaloperonospora arabidopsidis (strain Emoy2) TaxID=559515 RepID=M4BMX2_HYAAE